MPKRILLCTAVVAAVFAIPRPVVGQSWSEAQEAVWKVIADSWDAIADADVTWTDRFVHPNAVVWSDDYPMPRTRPSVKKWDAYEFQNSKTLAHEERLAAMVVQGNTAVAHYYYSLGTENREGKRRTVHGRCTDILISEGGRWQFIGWNCGEMPSEEE